MNEFWKNEWKPDEVPDSTNTPLPAGKYTCVITDSAMKDNKSGSGQHLSLTMQVIDGEYTNRLIWANLNIVNQNAEAERIGRSELKALCSAVGVLKPKDSTDLHDKPFVASVKIDPKDPTRNQVRGFSEATGSPAPAAKAEPPPAAKSTPPWKRK